jgi:signal peptidase I
METLFYHGSSMNPTFRVGDVLHLVPCDLAGIRRGDVVVFWHPERGNVVHRVVGVHEDGTLKTQGDNNDEADTGSVSPADVKGRVTHASRHRKLRPVHGGAVGDVTGLATRLLCSMRKRLFRTMRPSYLGLARRSIFGWMGALMNLRVVSYGRCGQHAELHLLLGNHCIGRLQPGQTRWQIKPPFRLFVDESSLPPCNQS